MTSSRMLSLMLYHKNLEFSLLEVGGCVTSHLDNVIRPNEVMSALQHCIDKPWMLQIYGERVYI